MTAVVRLVTSAETDDDADPRRLSVAARLEAELADGRRVVLLDDRGWTSSGPPEAAATVDDIAATARTVVGPDEPRPGTDAADEAARHWRTLAAELERSGVRIDPSALAAVPHDVVIGPRLRARLSGG